MPLYKKLCIVGGALFAVPLILSFLPSIFLSCYEYLFFPTLAYFLGDFFQYVASIGVISASFILAVPIGYAILLVSYVLWQISKGHSKISSIIKGFVLFLATLVVLSFFLASLNASRNKGPEASVKSKIASLRVEAEIYSDDNGGSYKDFCISQAVRESIDSIEKELPKQGLLCKSVERRVTCLDDNDTYAVDVRLFFPQKYGSATFQCIDSTGFFDQIDTHITGTSCNSEN